MHIKVLALDIESTLIDNTLSAEPRTGLYEFLVFCEKRFARVALFTTVDADDAREVVDHLVGNGHCPEEFAARLEYIEWNGEHKDLRFIPDANPEETLLVDDDAGWIDPSQHEQWIPVTPWSGAPDKELLRVRGLLERRLTGQKDETA